MSTVSVDDATLYYERDGAGPAMLFVHGMCGDADVWADQADRLAAQDTCVRYDRRGYSRSSRGARAAERRSARRRRCGSHPDP